MSLSSWAPTEWCKIIQQYIATVAELPLLVKSLQNEVADRAFGFYLHSVRLPIGMFDQGRLIEQLVFATAVCTAPDAELEWAVVTTVGRATGQVNLKNVAVLYFDGALQALRNAFPGAIGSSNEANEGIAIAGFLINAPETRENIRGSEGFAANPANGNGCISRLAFKRGVLPEYRWRDVLGGGEER